MKKLFLKLNNNLMPLWLIVHLGIPIILGLSFFFAPPLSISTQLFDMLPQTETAKIAKADNVLTERNNRETVIVFASGDFDKAKNAALSFYNQFKDMDEVENSTLLFDADTINLVAEYFYNHRFVIASDNTIDLLESGKADQIAMDALVMAYGAMNYIPLDNLDTDPFLLTERSIREFLTSNMMMAAGGIGIKDDVLSVERDGIWNVILRMTLTTEATSVVNIKNNIIGKFYSAIEFIEETDPELRIIFSGAPFHSYESASNAQREVTIIGIVSMSFVLLLFFYIFRSPIPLLFSILDILISLFLGTVTTFLIFREIHVFTFIFGTVLIGICIDYSIHFFTQWKMNTKLKNGVEIRNHISKSMIMCFISSSICYSAILFAPMGIFRQFAVFSIAGLLSSFLTAYCIYPQIKLPAIEKRQLSFPNLKTFFKVNFKPIPSGIRYGIAAFFTLIFIIILYFNPQGVKLNNDLGSLYAMPPHLEKNEMQVAIILDQTSMPLYYIISGSSAEETLQNEEKLAERLKEEIVNGNISSFMGTTVNIPSYQKQEKTYNSMNTLLPLAKLQYERLGFPSEHENIFIDNYNKGRVYSLPENAPLWTGISNLWIGEVDQEFYSCLFLFHVKDKEIFLNIADEFDFASLINIEEVINNDLNALTRIIVTFFFAAFFVVCVIVFIVFPVKDSIKICIVPVLVVLAVLTVLTLLKIPLGFLPIAATILVFGLGIDFMLYMSGHKKGADKDLTRFAVFLSFLTTTLSFGLLALSNFTPIYIFGLTIAVGLIAAFLFTMLLQGNSST